MMKAFVFSCSVFALLSSASTFADVVDSGAGGFTTRTSVTVNAPAARAYAALTKIGTWWNKDHTWSGNAANLSLDARVSGCFCEKLPNGGGVQHMTVIYAEPGKMLRLNGALGPLQDLAVTGVMTFTFTEANGKTTIDVTYKVGGYMAGGLNGLARPVDGVVAEQVMRLKQYVDSTP